MKLAKLALASALFGTAVGSRTRGGARPSEKLQTIQKKLDESSDHDKNAYDGVGCWCQTNLEAKQQVVNNMQAKLSSLGHDIDQQSAENQRYKVELSTHESDLADNQKALDQAEAIRQDQSAKFQEEHANTKANVNQLDDALAALSHPSAQYGFLEKMRHLLDGGSDSGSGSLFLQLSNKIGGSQSPELVVGVIKQMRNTFAADLEDMKTDEQQTAARHSDLARAKSQEISAIKSMIMSKKKKMTEGNVEVQRKKELEDRSEKLLEANQALLAALHGVCDGNEATYQSRRDVRQAISVALADAQTAIAGAELLAVGVGARSPDMPDPKVEELCLAAIGIRNSTWKAAAKAACETARKGKTQDAADACDALKDDIAAARHDAAAAAEDCQRAQQDAAAQHKATEDSMETEYSVISNDKGNVEAQIDDINQQSSTCDAAKAKLAEARQAQHQVMQDVRLESTNAAEILKHAESTVPQAAISHLREAAQSYDQLSQAAGDYDSAATARAEKATGALDATVRACAKVMIPLKLMHADAEEAAVSLHEERNVEDSLSKGGAASCDAASLNEKVKEMDDYMQKLSTAAEGLAWDTLR